jgi:hypothetical protein
VTGGQCPLWGHFRTWRIVLPESVVRSKADISQALPMSLDLRSMAASSLRSCGRILALQKSDIRGVPIVLCFVQAWRASRNKTTNFYVVEIAF